jgi:hypothetical protein
VQWDSLPENTFTGLGSHECICNVGINEIESNLKINSFPNPVSSSINIIANENIKLVEFFDIAGKSHKLLNFANTSVNVTIDVQNLTNGIYFAKVTDTKGNARLVKFSKN